MDNALTLKKGDLTINYDLKGHLNLLDPSLISAPRGFINHVERVQLFWNYCLADGFDLQFTSFTKTGPLVP
jgi:hypothetical protein